MGAVHLSVADLGRSVGYYESAIGLRVHERAGGRARLGAGGEDLLVRQEEPGAPPARGTAGLYHFALLVPERADLARWLAHAAREEVPLVGMADHYVSEAIYLSDPDEHGIEVYWDRPREVWEGQVGERMTTLPLDVADLFGVIGDPRTEPFEALASGTVMGHVHLRVSEVPATAAFYCDALGFGLMAAFGASALFMSAGGYHHHLGANIWESRGAGQPPPGHATLLRATIVLPTAADVDRLAGEVVRLGQEPEPLDDGVLVRDPSGNAVALVAEGSATAPTSSPRARHRQPDEARDDHRDVRDARHLLEHDDAARERPDRHDVAQPGAREIREAQEQQLDPRAVLVRTDRGREAVRRHGLADDEDVREAPRDERERRPDGEELVAADLVVREHVREQAAGGVEVEDRLERRRPRQQLVAPGHRLHEQQHARRQREQDTEPRPRRRAAHGEDHEAEERHAEHAEERAAGRAVLHHGVGEQRRELGGEQDRRRFPAREAEHGGTVASAPVVAASARRRWREKPAPLRRCRAEQARVVRDDPGDPEALEPGDALGVVDGPHVELAAGGLDRPDEPRRDERPVAHERVDPARAHLARDPARQHETRVLSEDERGDAGPAVAQRVAPDLRHRPADAHVGRGAAQLAQAVLLHRREQRAVGEPVRAQRVDDAAFVARQLQVDVELDAGPRVLGEVGEALLERQCRAAGGGEVVGEHEPPAAVLALGQHVELDHVDPGRQRGVEARERVAGRDEVRALVADALGRAPLLTHVWHPAHQYVRRLLSPCPRERIGAPHRGHG